MSRLRRVSSTKLEIIKVATRMFLEKGYTNASIKAICDELGISTGNLTFHFPTKEHLLAILVKLLCDFQWQKMEDFAGEGKTSLMALCLEFTSIATICEERPIERDFYYSAYTMPMTLDIIRRNDAEKAKQVFKDYCKDWTDLNFREAEILVSGIEYATFMTTASSAPLDVRVEGALSGIMKIYNVPEDVIKKKIQKVLSMDYRALSRQIFSEFILFIEDFTENSLETLFKK